MFKLNMLYIALSFSVHGFLEFLVLLIKTISEVIFLQKFNKNFDFLLIFAMEKCKLYYLCQKEHKL